ncbi:MAG: AbrB/MazE/SpoVT family DNA-binding domain-containing protein [Candidatus Tectomicrobia bacterium]|uniref:AbrB/MazE/SpoVT family DNA-binding domain-containing protein n=1 Tax=Tectimicrobiota bacterium TaxID=2528274 RepID=A0A932CRF3_UNCTE|nr:AbrB/MazE/SpoVT family DNA-binding domain-containing protein [Candidatus Tectomicrobia bacterium]
MALKTTVSTRFQTVIPTELRKKFNIKANSKLEWIDGGKVLIVVAVPADPIGAIRGMFKGKGLADALVESRQEERRHLEEKEPRGLD